MPNRAPTTLSSSEASALLASLPDLSMDDAEDDEDRKRIKTAQACRGRLNELKASLADDASGSVIFSVDEVDLLLDGLPLDGDPTPGGIAAEIFAGLRTKFSELLREVSGG